MRDGGQISLKPALLRAAQGFALSDDVLICTDADGAELWRMDLRDVTQAGFVTHIMQRNHLWRFDLIDGAGRRESVSLTFPVSGGEENPDRHSFLTLSAALGAGLDRHAPDLRIALAEYGRSRWWFFGIGAASALAGAGLLGAALVTGVSATRMVPVGIGSGLLLLLGGVFVYGYRPWISPPSLSPAQLVATLQANAPAETE